MRGSPADRVRGRGRLYLPRAVPFLRRPHVVGPAGAAGGRNPTTESILANAGDISFLLDNNLVFAGSPRTVTERIKAAASEGLFNTLLGEFNLGLMTGADIAESVRLFATEVAPSL